MLLSSLLLCNLIRNSRQVRSHVEKFQDLSTCLGLKTSPKNLDTLRLCLFCNYFCVCDAVNATRCLITNQTVFRIAGPFIK